MKIWPRQRRATDERDRISADEYLSATEVAEVFNDPRYKHLSALGDHNDDEPELLGYDRELILQALSAIYNIRSAEKQGKAMARATWGLVFATVGLVIATIVLVVVTVKNG